VIDQSKKLALIEHIKRRQISPGSEILLGVGLYFDGYDEDHCTICANNIDSISTTQFAARLRAIEQRPDVSCVFVRFYTYDDALEDEDSWIGSDSVYIITSAGLDVVRGWFADFDVSDVWEETDLSKFADLPEMPDGFRLVAVWWD
jgi:hypothetical protein